GRHIDIAVEDLPEKLQRYHRSHVVIATDDPAELVSMEELERGYILRALDTLGGNRTLTAEKLGLDRKTLYRKLKQWGLQPSAAEEAKEPREARETKDDDAGRRE